ncbi:hypothetical protein BC831DRAFT_485150 [Entophlyctis helioformis]|nr:hypothetical protein BC831DRAFT_485150 [Entophlyctis helioformis]
MSSKRTTAGCLMTKASDRAMRWCCATVSAGACGPDGRRCPAKIWSIRDAMDAGPRVGLAGSGVAWVAGTAVDGVCATDESIVVEAAAEGKRSSKSSLSVSMSVPVSVLVSISMSISMSVSSPGTAGSSAGGSCASVCDCSDSDTAEISGPSAVWQPAAGVCTGVVPACSSKLELETDACWLSVNSRSRPRSSAPVPSAPVSSAPPIPSLSRTSDGRDPLSMRARLVGGAGAWVCMAPCSSDNLLLDCCDVPEPDPDPDVEDAAALMAALAALAAIR